MDASKIVIDSGGVIYVFPEDGSVISVIEQPEVTSFAWSMSASDDILMAGAPFNLQGQGISSAMLLDVLHISFSLSVFTRTRL